MPKRKAKATWSGGLMEGLGHMAVDSGVLDADYSVGTRMEDKPGTNPEELIGAAHAGCFSMALSMVLGEKGHEPKNIDTEATVTFKQVEGDWTITEIKLTTRANVPGMSEDDFKEAAEMAKKNCPVSRALAGTDIQLDAALQS